MFDEERVNGSERKKYYSISSQLTSVLNYSPFIEFNEWAKRRGIVAPKIAYAEFETTGRGMIALDDIEVTRCIAHPERRSPCISTTGLSYDHRKRF